MRKFLGLLVACLGFAGCGGGDEPEDPPRPVEPVGTPWRYWSFVAHDVKGRLVEESSQRQGAGEVSDTHVFGDLALTISGKDLIADGQVYSSESGATYWVETEAPIGNIGDATSTIGSNVQLYQAQRYRKLAANASLELVITDATLEAFDFNGPSSLGAQCPWLEIYDADRCFDRIFAMLWMAVSVLPAGSHEIVDSHFGGAVLQGWGSSWHSNVYVEPTDAQAHPIFKDANVEVEMVSSSGYSDPIGAIYKIKAPITIHVDLSAIAVGEEFTLESRVNTSTDNRRGRESYVGARLRDPINPVGMRVESTGLQALPTPAGPFAHVPGEEPRCSANATQPEAGIVEFSAERYFEPEFGSPGPGILVKRTGGNAGTLVVTVRSADDTAIAGLHYEALDQRVVFPDGDDTPRAIDLRVIDDDIAHGDRRARLMLEADAGCANLGARDSVLVHIVDDDVVVERTHYSVGGTVTGLEGAGLVIDEVRTGNQLTPTNGTFTFPYEFSAGDDYEVRISAQPANPLQVCRLENGSGVVSGDVTNVAITCETPPAGATLDPAFGSGGRVTGHLPGEGRAVALQSDGKLVVLGKSHLARFHANGTPDTSFGNNGLAPVTFTGALGEEAMDVALQPDGRIVVAGFTRATSVTTNYDFAVARFEANGTLDLSFGNGGIATVDFDGEPDKAESLVLQPDGRMLLGGYASLRVPLNIGSELRTGFGVARFNVDGSLDTSFSHDGKVRAHGGSSFAHVVALAPDGKILAAGRSASNGAAEPWAALARWHPDGSPDNNQDQDPDVYLGVDGSEMGRDEFNGSTDIVRDLLVTANGQLIAVLRSPLGKENLILAELLLPFGDAIGRPSSILGTDVALGPGTDYGEAVAETADGKFVVVGAASSASTVSDFAIVRFGAGRVPDPAFNGDGSLTIDFFGGADAATDLVIQPDGKIVVVGVAWNGSGYGFAMARVLP